MVDWDFKVANLEFDFDFDYDMKTSIKCFLSFFPYKEGNKELLYNLNLQDWKQIGTQVDGTSLTRAKNNGELMRKV